QLKLAGKFRRAKGIILGGFHPEDVDSLRMAIDELLVPEGVPILAGFPCGHGLPALTLPLGARVYMDADAKYVNTGM
ncbi:MAG: LD-carboxypeptidase, partial [Clostridiales bacterium]|nr:LD-carboxypeptidase [Clostridiales bacterium]